MLISLEEVRCLLLAYTCEAAMPTSIEKAGVLRAKCCLVLHRVARDETADSSLIRRVTRIYANRSPGKVGKSSSSTTHGSLLPTKMSILGGTFAGSSRDPVVTSISSIARRDEKVRDVPQRGQNVRVPSSEEEKAVGSPDISVNAFKGTLNHVTKGAPLVRRHIVQ
jgi:hypothetical protein